MNYLERIITEIELHSVEGIKECFEHGVSPNDFHHGEPLIYELISEYARTPGFRNCVKVFLDYGLEFEDEPLLSVLLNDAGSLERQLKIRPEIISKRYTLRVAYTPIYQATLMHVCAEFNHVSCAEVLKKFGADINAKAGTDEHRFGGQTPVFHTVNQNSNNSIDMLKFLLANSVDLEITVPGIIWGKGYQWETLIPAVNPISYAMMGLLPQMHRDEIIISDIVTTLLKHSFLIDYRPKNIPNAYLKP